MVWNNLWCPRSTKERESFVRLELSDGNTPTLRPSRYNPLLRLGPPPVEPLPSPLSSLDSTKRLESTVDDVSSAYTSASNHQPPSQLALVSAKVIRQSHRWIRRPWILWTNGHLALGGANLSPRYDSLHLSFQSCDRKLNDSNSTDADLSTMRTVSAL